MKKLFFTLLFVFVLFTINAQDNDSINQDITNVERIIDKYSSKVTSTITNIVEELKEPAKEVFKIVVKLQTAKGIFLLILSSIGLFLIIINIVNFNTWNDDSGGTSLIFLGISLLLFLISLYHGLIRVIVPEWYAILELTNLVK